MHCNQQSSGVLFRVFILLLFPFHLLYVEEEADRTSVLIRISGPKSRLEIWNVDLGKNVFERSDLKQKNWCSWLLAQCMDQHGL